MEKVRSSNHTHFLILLKYTQTRKSDLEFKGLYCNLTSQNCLKLVGGHQSCQQMIEVPLVAELFVTKKGQIQPFKDRGEALKSNLRGVDAFTT